jgi:hypothetical protein
VAGCSHVGEIGTGLVTGTERTTMTEMHQLASTLVDPLVGLDRIASGEA